MAATIVTVETALQILAQVVPLIQTAVANGQPIDAATWAEAISARDGAQAQLDADIKAGKGR
jgi:hypothetical protein